MAMSVQEAPARTAGKLAPGPLAERAAWSAHPALGILIHAAVFIAGLQVLISWSGPRGGDQAGRIALGVLLVVGAYVIAHGVISVVGGEASVVQVFGRYTGTVRDPGMHFVNPMIRRRKVSVRIRNLESPIAKVNDADGNPIEIAAVVVWQVQDTAKALYGVDDYPTFVAIQTETAVRHVASAYPYTSHHEGQLSLRDNAEEITARLSAEIAERVAPAGVSVIESRLTRLSYAPEIAPAMLRQQQAAAVVGARRTIVEGAVGMVRLALQQLEEQGVVELDEERRAAMVSNLLVVLCSEQATQQIVNTGSLY
jgi:regulator of protease activity HflC (stomatin/prohibitin superfamily)